MNELALFTGAGGGILGGRILGWRTRCAVEINPYCRRVLLQRQLDGMLEEFPVWDDVCTFDGRPWRGGIDIVSGGFPCQDISSAGKGKGIAGSRSGLVFHMLRIIEEIRPSFAFAENSPLLRTRGLGTILSAFNQMGYNVAWCVLGAGDLGAPHQRWRMWLLAADTFSRRREIRWAQGESHEGNSTIEMYGRVQHLATEGSICQHMDPGKPGCGVAGVRWDQQNPWDIEPDVGRVANGVAYQMDRIRALGNGQVPAVAATAFAILSEALRGHDEMIGKKDANYNI